jgi:hypothetical protein
LWIDNCGAVMRRAGLAGLMMLTGVALMLAQNAPQVVAPAAPMSAAEAAARLSGRWKLNEELSRPLSAGTSPPAFDDDSRNARRSPGFGQVGRPQAYEAERLVEERNIKVRALNREFEVAPTTLALAVSVATATFVDAAGAERVIYINQKKEKLDLGTAIVDSRARWNGAALTIELDGGSDLKVLEIFELSPTGAQMLVTIRPGDERDENARGLRGQVQRVYDRVNADRR